MALVTAPSLLFLCRAVRNPPDENVRNTDCLLALAGMPVGDRLLPHGSPPRPATKSSFYGSLRKNFSSTKSPVLSTFSPCHYYCHCLLGVVSLYLHLHPMTHVVTKRSSTLTAPGHHLPLFLATVDHGVYSRQQWGAFSGVLGGSTRLEVVR